MYELKRCPICGLMPQMRFIMIDEPVTNFDKYYQVGCPECRLFKRYTIRKLNDSQEHEKAKYMLADAWNAWVDRREDLNEHRG